MQIRRTFLAVLFAGATLMSAAAQEIPHKAFHAQPPSPTLQDAHGLFKLFLNGELTMHYQVYDETGQVTDALVKYNGDNCQSTMVFNSGYTIVVNWSKVNKVQQTTETMNYSTYQRITFEGAMVRTANPAGLREQLHYPPDYDIDDSIHIISIFPQNDIVSGRVLRAAQFLEQKCAPQSVF